MPKSSGLMMTVQEFAKAMGKGPEWAFRELRMDSKRGIHERQYPFATPSCNEETGQWSYNIARSRFERWLAGDDIAIGGVDFATLSSEIATAIVRNIALRMASEDTPQV